MQRAPPDTGSDFPELHLSDVLTAQSSIRGIADNTPLIPSPFLSALIDQDFLLKLENTQPMGAFKLRGALHALENLPTETKGVTCVSTGNHGRAVAFAAARLGMRAAICMSSLVPQAKIDGIKALGAEVHIHGKSQDEAQHECDRLVAEEGLTEVPPFDDPFVIAGQGTIGLELMAARPDLETLLVPMSGGGLAAGIAVAAKAVKPDLTVIGISMDRGAAMHASMVAGNPVEVPEFASLADSLGGGIGLKNRYSYPLCRALLDDLILVTEEEIYHAMQTLFYEDRIVAEGACVVGIAGLQSGKIQKPDGPTATIITGRNVDMRVFHRIMAGNDIELGGKTVKGKVYAG